MFSHSRYSMDVNATFKPDNPFIFDVLGEYFGFAGGTKFHTWTFATEQAAVASEEGGSGGLWHPRGGGMQMDFATVFVCL